MSLGAASILNAIVSHAMATGSFERVNTHEPKNRPGNGLSAAIWYENIRPIRASGLDSTSVRIEFRIRVFTNMLQEPQDAIDPNVVDAVDLLLETYTGDFSLGSIVRNIDLLGAHGPAMGVQAGYVKIDSKLYRFMEITLPVIANDVWSQEA